MGQLILYLGGAKSGKTRLALAKAETFPAPRLYLATAQSLDDEMGERIKNHQAERGPDWRTLEQPFNPEQTISGLNGDSVIMLDCLTLWLSNLLVEDQDQPNEAILEKVKLLIEAVDTYKGTVIVVSNEVGGGIVPINALARKFRDLAGAANQILAARADQVVMAVAGLELVLK